ncbi:MAG: hypothetical protein WCI05_04370 [Myxococcales bacterium]
MFRLEEVLQLPPFGMDAVVKRELYLRALADLTRHHGERCAEYGKILALLGYRPGSERGIEDFPFIPVRLFKEFNLLSIDQADIVKTMTSSGTTGQAVSRIFLDRETATNQTKVLVKIVSSLTGSKRLPFLVVDCPSVVKDRSLFSARGAGILGFSMLGRDPTYLLTDDLEIDYVALEAFLSRHAGEKVLLFGFTFMVWEHLCGALERAGHRLAIDGVLIHGGGWKKLASLAIDSVRFRKTVHETTGVSTVINYYGMVEQTGSIFVECEEGQLHASIFSDILIRDPRSFLPLGPGNIGLVQLLSLLPTSYPGHSILTEDLGEILGIDDCPCGRKGARFRIHGRVKDAELRGCSDVQGAAKGSDGT